MWRKNGRVLFGVLLGVALSSIASAQSAITGVVSDASGAILPGVSVEVSSPALIEQSREAVTDSSGNYRVTTVWVHRNGTWQLVAVHMTRIAQ